MKKFSLTFLIVVILSLMCMDGVVHARTIPTISILGVTKDEKVTVKTFNFPSNKEFRVRMGLIGTKGVDGILVGTVDSGKGGSLTFTFDIPADLFSKNQIAIRLETTTSGYFAYNWFDNLTFGSHNGGIPAEDATTTLMISVASVKKDAHVIMKGSDFPTDESFVVLMGKFGTQGTGGIRVETIRPGYDGSFVKIFDIPENLKTESKIAIRFESNNSDLTVHTWFENKTGASGGFDGSGGTISYTGIPTMTILSVKEDQEVTIGTHNFPAGKDFNVLMGLMGTRGIGGILVTTIGSGVGGEFTKTFEIPEALKGEYQIAIRLQTPDGHFFAYNWFYNNTTGGEAPSSYTGFPTFSISDVLEDSKVTINTNNFPVNYDFNVLMGKYGTQGIGGINVTTFNSGSGGTFTETFNIPASLAGDNRIAIRLETTSAGFFAYNWFYNATYP